MKYLPLFHDIKGKTCLVVGGGDVAYRKCKFLVNARADIKVIGKNIDEKLEKFLTKRKYAFAERKYDKRDIEGCCLVVAATSVREVNQQIYTDCVAKNIPVNVVDEPDLCTFIFPSVIDRSPITVAISSGGTSPVLSRLLKNKLEAFIPQNYGKLSEIAGSFRSKVKAKFGSVRHRRYFWEKILQGPVAEMVFNNRIATAEKLFDQILEDAEDTPSNGEVYLVGAGPGDPDLISIRALRLIQQADIVLHDRLVSEPILNLCRKDAHMIYVGKEKSNHSVPQNEINETLAKYAKQGLKVLRLKGGDPFIFGRGGEEIELLAEQGIPFQVVPGITAASGCAAYAGIPLTHRDHAQSVRFLTGHLKDGNINLEWPELLDDNQTLVFYMSLTGISQICQRLIEHGKNPETPIALIEKGTTENQQVHISNLRDLPNLIARKRVKAPTISIIGDVVSLHDKLNWYS